MLQQAKRSFSQWGVILRPWLCVVLYVWGLEFQAVYGAGFETLLDRLASGALLLWTSMVWATLFSATISLVGFFCAPFAVRRLNEFVCRAACLLASGYYLNRWLGYWRPEDEKSNLIFWLLILAIAPLYLALRRRRIKSGTPSQIFTPSWNDCFYYIVVPVLFVTVVSVVGKTALSVAAKNKFSTSIAEARAHAGKGQERPNVIIIVSDSLRAQSMSLYGHHGKTTPVIDEFARNSTVYLNAHTNGSTTVASVLSILTGRHPLSHGRFNRELPPQPDNRNLLTLLREHGYTIAAVTSNGDASLASQGLTPALTEPEVMAFEFQMFSWLHPYGVYPTRFSGRMYQDLTAIMPFLAFPKRASVDGNVVDAMASATELITHLRKPFFLFIHIHEPHSPHYLPNDFKLIPIALDPASSEAKTGLGFYAHYAPEFQPVVNAYRDVYEKTITAVDSELGKFFKSLESTARYGKSMVIFMADHGESFERGYFYHGEELYENSTWIPLVVRYPGQTSGARVSGLTQPVDVAPTILNALQIAVPDWLDGQALKRDVRPGPVATIATNLKHPDKDAVYYFPTKLALWWNHYKLIASCEAGKSVLYDLQDDPGEQTDISALHPAMLNELKLRLKLQLSRQSQKPGLDCSNL